MNVNGVTSSDIISWIENSLGDQHFNNYEITLTGKTEKGDGYVGEIVFASVDGSTTENEGRVLNLVIKHAKKNEHLRKTVPIKNCFEKEIHLYEKVFPTFKKFQRDKNVTKGFESVPRCYNTLVLDNMEVLVLDNLRMCGYELHDRKKPLNLEHLKAIVTEYGKFHALSFALRDQESGTFDELVGSNNDIFRQYLADRSVRESMQQCVDDVLNILKERNEVILFNKFKNVLVKKTHEILIDIFNEDEPQSVITHGDCWNNNFMFKYKNADRTSPTQIAILDWQISTVHSPALELSHFIYSNSSKEELDKFDEIMETYYASFSHFLRELGSNPDELFTYSDLRRHWKKYSLLGVLFMAMLLRFALCNKEDAPALEDLQEGEDVGAKMLINIADKDAFYDRAKAVVEHYFDNVF